jgi:hypothetical protein
VRVSTAEERCDEARQSPAICKVLQFAQWCHALEVLGKKLKSTSKTRKMLLASTWAAADTG